MKDPPPLLPPRAALNLSLPPSVLPAALLPPVISNPGGTSLIWILIIAGAMLSYSLLLFVLVAVGAGDALKCFECNSRNDSACALEKPPETLKKDCLSHQDGSKYTLCRKIVQTIEYEVNGLKPETRIIRSCGWDASSYLGSCYQRSGFGGRQEVCTCVSDYCNSASLLALPVLLVAVLAALPRLL